MNTKYTPGPWRTDDRYHGCVLAGGTQVAAATMNGFLSAEERDANARLIAAAPDLLKQLRNLVALFDAEIPPTNVEAARAAIVEAMGDRK